MVYLDQFVCLSDGVNLKVVATSIAEIDRPVYHDVRNSMPHPTISASKMAGKSAPIGPFGSAPVLPSSKMSLLPPSYFLAKKQPEKSNEEEDDDQKNTGELQKLKEENEKLRTLLGCSKGRMEEMDVPCNTVPLAEHVRMKAQFQECIELLKTENIAHCDKIVQLEKLRIKEREEFEARKSERVSALETVQESLSEELERLCSERDRLIRDKDNKMSELRASMEEERRGMMSQLQQARDQVAEKERTVAAIQSEKEEALECLKEEVSSLENQLSLKDKEISNLVAKLNDTKKFHDLQMDDCHQRLACFRGYLGMESPPGGDFTWKQERQSLLAQNSSLQGENLTLSREVELVNTRLTAMTQMLALQESELSKSSTGSKGQLRLNKESQDVPTLLLTRWREKVFSLLVQMKSNELLEQEAKRRFAGEKADLVEEIDRLKHEKDLLTCSLEDRTAQLGIERERVRSLENRASHLETRCMEAACENEALQEKLGSLSTLVHRFPVALSQHREMLVHAQSRLVGYERRLDFAHKRIQTFHALHKKITSTEENLPLNTICSSTQTEQEDNVLQQEEDLKTLSKEQLVVELSQITVERQQLIDHIARLTEEQAEKERVSTEEFEAEVNALRDLLQCAQEERDALSTKCEDLSARLSEVESSKSELVEEHDCLTLEVEELRAKLDQNVQKALLEERGKVKEEFAEMERHLNEVRREHAKMAVILQQTKRDAIRERERLVRSHELEREQLEEEVDTYKAKLSSITAERNLLANAVRQDGRIKSALPKVIHPTPRPLPIQQVVVDSDRNSSPNSTISSESRRTYTVNGENNPSEEDVENDPPAVSPIEHVEEQGKVDLYTALQDLQKLSTDLLRLERNH